MDSLETFVASLPTDVTTKNAFFSLLGKAESAVAADGEGWIVAFRGMAA
jgi:hypothetical protein